MRHAVGNEVVLEAGQAADEGVRADAGELDARRRRRRKSTKSPTVHWPASITLLDRMTSLPTLAVVRPHGSWRGRRSGRRPRSSGRRPRCRDSSSRLRGSGNPTRSSSVDGSPRIFQVLRLMADGGEREDPRASADRGAGRPPTTWLTSSQPSPSSTSGPTMQNGPIFDARAESRRRLR